MKMNLPGHSVDCMRAHNSQMRHVDSFPTLLFNNGENPHFFKIIVVFLGHKLHMEVIDFVDDLQMSRQEIFQHRHGPTLKGLRQDSVVGVSTDTLSYIPCLEKNNNKYSGDYKITKIDIYNY